MTKENYKKIEKKPQLAEIDFQRELSQVKELPQVFNLLKKIATARFDEAIECAFRIMPKKKKTDKTVRGSLSLPHSVLKNKPRIAVFASGDDVQKALDAGATTAGLESLIEEVMGEKAKYDYYVATKAVFGQIAKVARVLKSAMPNLKSGTVTDDIQSACKKLLDGIIQYRDDKHSIIHCKIGYRSFTVEQLISNFNEMTQHLYTNYNNGRSVNEFFQSVYISSTMSRSIPISHHILSTSIKTIK